MLKCYTGVKSVCGACELLLLPSEENPKLSPILARIAQAKAFGIHIHPCASADIGMVINYCTVVVVAVLCAYTPCAFALLFIHKRNFKLDFRFIYSSCGMWIEYFSFVQLCGVLCCARCESTTAKYIRAAIAVAQYHSETESIWIVHVQCAPHRQHMCK